MSTNHNRNSVLHHTSREKTPTKALLLLTTSMVLGSVQINHAQGLPTEQPKVLTIIREHVKVGRAADHSKYEAGYPAAMEKAKSPDYYLAITSLSGPSEAWYLLSQPSFTKVAESMKRDEKDALLTAQMDQLDAGDAANISAVETIRTIAHKA